MIKIGHRGAAGIEPENTLRAIDASIECGMDAVEVDVRRTKDNYLVIMHDEKVDRTTNGSGYVADMTLSELQELDAGKGEKIPTLQQVIDTVKGKCKLLIEIKEPTTEVKVAEMIERNNFQNGCYVISFYHPIVRMVKAYSKKLHTGVLFVGEPVDAVGMVKEAHAEIAVANYRSTTPAMVSKLHNANLKIFVWNCDKEEDIQRMEKLGVDGIATNRPDVLAEVLKNGD
jgi:glycerophosphoryl diester phosphodiesterase